jgi:hypothetical protein
MRIRVQGSGFRKGCRADGGKVFVFPCEGEILALAGFGGLNETLRMVHGEWLMVGGRGGGGGRLGPARSGCATGAAGGFRVQGSGKRDGEENAGAVGLVQQGQAPAVVPQPRVAGGKGDGIDPQ